MPQTNIVLVLIRSNCDRRLRGKKAILSISPINLLPLIAQACDDKITAVGGLDA